MARSLSVGMTANSNQEIPEVTESAALNRIDIPEEHQRTVSKVKNDAKSVSQSREDKSKKLRLITEVIFH